MRSGGTRALACLGALLHALLAAGAASGSDDGWILDRRDESPGGGYELYHRQVPGESFATWRLETDLAAPLELVERVTLRNALEGSPGRPGHRRTLLRREGETVFWIHTEIPVALAADRDVVLRLERRRDPTTGALRIEWRAEPDEGPAPKSGVVRMRVSHGFWEFTPVAEGRTHASYESYAEPGGPFPRWLVDVISSGEVMDALTALRDSLAEAADPSRPNVVSAFGG